MHTKVLMNMESNRLRDEEGHLIATVWTRDVDEQRKDGESWLDMRARTKPLHAAAVAEAAANARLFAAAPALLAALQGVLRVADRATDEFDAARAAIAQATAAQ